MRETTEPGTFIVFEGGDGAGKTTQIDLLVEALRRDGLVDGPGLPSALVTREPGGTALGSGLRELVLHGADMAPVAEALLYAADRAQHVAEVVAPALARGDVVISDRYLDSSIAYQVEGRGLSESQVREVNAPATGGLEPDLTVLMDVGVATAARRRAESGEPADRLEGAGREFHTRVNTRYRSLAAEGAGRYLVVDAEGPVEENHGAILARVGELLRGRP
jgi:dTMP kinase